MRRFGDVLLALGLVVGIGSVVGYELDIIPTLPPEVLKLVIYKLAFIGGLGLLAAGALVRRLASHRAENAQRAPDLNPTNEARLLSETANLPLNTPSSDRDLERLREP